MTDTAAAPLTKRIYAPAQARRLGLGIVSVFGGVVVASGASDHIPWLSQIVYDIVLRGRHDSSPYRGISTGQQELLFLLAVPLVVFGLLRLWQSYRGLPRLVVTKEGLILETLFRKRAANWDSLGRFELRQGGWSTRQIVAAVTGAAASDIVLSERKLVIPDAFLTSPDDLAIDLNSRCGGAFGPLTPSTTIPVDLDMDPPRVWQSGKGELPSLAYKSRLHLAIIGSAIVWGALALGVGLPALLRH
jgi:hypothetical protein